ncbi:hypothetical protein [uncultured Roseobacter sp.]|uniref:hypothetical protein n=1 Tax=uncultured Roseobacter sp. TaxID=114847 RepID=UPI00261AC5FD|nr:hypothetical protein [uncultured Roseobacter sp.]
MALIRTDADLDALRPLTPGEVQLLAASRAGETCRLGDGALPSASAPRREQFVRADVLRYLILGGCPVNPVATMGIDLHGAFVSGTLNLAAVETHGSVGLQNCCFDRTLTVFRAQFSNLRLDGSRLKGLNGHGLSVANDVMLRGITDTGGINLFAARIGGRLDCSDADISPDKHLALNAKNAAITGGVTLAGLVAHGRVSFNSAGINGQMNCENARFRAWGAAYAFKAQDASVRADMSFSGAQAEGEVNLAGVEVGGRLVFDGAALDSGSAAPEATAVKLVRMRVAEGLHWKAIRLGRGRVSLTAAHVGDLVHDLKNDMESWPSSDRFDLDGFTYDRITGPSISPRVFIEWLKKGSVEKENFLPQPFTQLARVLRERGHDRDSRLILAERDRLIMKNIRDRARITEFDGTWRTAFRSLFRDGSNIRRYAIDVLLRRTVGYGYRPFRSMWMLATLVVVAVALAHLTWEEGSFVPSAEAANSSETWRALTLSGVDNPAAVWSGRMILGDRQLNGPAPGLDYPRFNAIAWGADLVIPIIEFGQTAHWGPSTQRGFWGLWLWRASFFLAAAGWIVTALGAAAITGIIRRE